MQERLVLKQHLQDALQAEEKRYTTRHTARDLCKKVIWHWTGKHRGDDEGSSQIDTANSPSEASCEATQHVHETASSSQSEQSWAQDRHQSDPGGQVDSAQLPTEESGATAGDKAHDETQREETQRK